jgi:demethylmenaquinone methyltransferase/2-methoxy-6-polyprenyl-1,4-benzoquinol methylase
MVTEDALLAQQIAYYRRRAAEFDLATHGVGDETSRRIAALVDDLRPTGRVLELACGTGMWTAGLARWATTLTAVDAAPEMIALARTRTGDAAVRFEVADLFEWRPSSRYDVVFFAFWLSHVPRAKFEEFWALVAEALAPGGRAVFVDEPIHGGSHEAFVGDSEEIVERRLADGSSHRLVRVFWDPPDLQEHLTRMGWRTRVRAVDKKWMVGQAWDDRAE